MTEQANRVVQESLTWSVTITPRLLRITICSLFALILSVILIAILILTEKKPQYFAVTPDMRIQELIALDQPYIQSAGLSNWVAQTIASTFNLNFRNWREQLGLVRSSYDPEAFTSLVMAMKDNGVLDIIEEKRLVCSAIIQTTPIIHASGMQKGVYMWRLKMPVLISYESSRGVEHTQKLVADVLVQRISTLENPVSVNIRQIILATEK